MTETTHRVELEILGQRYAIRTEASPDHVRRLAAYLDEKLREIGGEGIREPVKLLALAALYITDELFRAREERARVDGDLNARVDALLRLLDDVTPPDQRTA